MALADHRLTDRVTEDVGTVLMTGVQALARLPVEQLRVDRAAGLRTAAFASGYPGSPLAGFDQELQRAAGLAPDLPIVVRPALNEELGASAVMGSQLVSSRPDARYDGVVGLWYGKAPGLDRSSDALRHAVFAGTAPHGGAVALVGDDPAAKSSTLPSSSDATLVDLHLPILYPADAGEALELGRHAIALSRASGLWVGLKVVSAVADGSASVTLGPDHVRPVVPTIDGEPYRCRPDGLLLGAHSLEIERELRGVRAELARAYATANGLNRVTVDAPDAWLGLIASGLTYLELMEALGRLGLDEAALRASGIRVLQMRQPIPFDPATVRRFAAGLEEVMVVEEMNPTLARLVRDALYGATDRPLVTGKEDRHGRPQFPSDGPLTADRMVEPLRRALTDRLGDRLAPAPAPERQRSLLPLVDQRTPAFCSGCPHNHSTRVPDGTLVGAGIGCHTMAMLSDDERLGEIVCLTAMGNEGAPWFGMADFVEADHFTQNLGDGTYFHSGQLAVQAAVAAGVDMTFKLLFNGHVAMTGGQLPPGQRSVGETVAVLVAQGVARVIVTTDDVRRTRSASFPPGVEVWDRTRMIEAQQVLAATPGVTVLVHDQACAAELRRARKRGRAPTPQRRLVINERVCEGCGDCAEVSSCLSVRPVDTPFGRKTRIDHDSCNLDESCLDGDCPSFLVVRPAVSRPWHRWRPPTSPPDAAPQDPPTVAAPPTLEWDDWHLRLAGIGGTGVVTAAQVLATAAVLDGHEVAGLDQTGLSQKAGPVVSDLTIRRPGGPKRSNHLGDGQAELLLAFDALVGATDRSLEAASPDRTGLVASSSATPTASQVVHPERGTDDPGVVRGRLDASCRPGSRWVDAAATVERVGLPGATANTFLVGVALQAGLVPVSVAALERAIELNGVAVEANLAALRWGRAWADDPDAVGTPGAEPARHRVVLSEQLGTRVGALGELGVDADLRSAVARRAHDLVGFADEALAGRYLELVGRVARAERDAGVDGRELTGVVAEQLHRVLAVTDEYEVARLLLDEETARRAGEVLDGPVRTAWVLHPPLLRDRGLDHKIEVGTWTAPAMRVLAAGKRLRGTRWDPFARTEVRRAERDLAGCYLQVVDALAADLDADRHPLAVELASIPASVRGYEQRKLAGARDARQRLERGAAAWRAALADRGSPRP